jgi:hypothetical protein
MLNLTSLIAPVSGLLDKFIEDKDKKNALAHEIATMAERHAQELAKAQIEVNKTEAAHTSLFVAGWRPACGNFLVIPVANFILALVESAVTVPVLDLSQMMPVLMGMLGLGVMRTAEKVKGVQREK